MEHLLNEIKSKITTSYCFNNLNIKNKSYFEQAQILYHLGLNYFLEENLNFCKLALNKSYDCVVKAFENEILNNTEQHLLYDLCVENINLLIKCDSINNFLNNYSEIKKLSVYNKAKLSTYKLIKILCTLIENFENNKNLKNTTYAKESIYFIINELINISSSPEHFDIFIKHLMKHFNEKRFEPKEIEKILKYKPLIHPFLEKNKKKSWDNLKNVVISEKVTMEKLYEIYRYSLYSKNMYVFEKFLEQLFAIRQVLKEEEIALIEMFNLLNLKFQNILKQFKDKETEKKHYNFLVSIGRKDIIYMNMDKFLNLNINQKMDILIYNEKHDEMMNLYENNSSYNFNTDSLIYIYSIKKLETPIINLFKKIECHNKFMDNIKILITCNFIEVIGNVIDVFFNKFDIASFYKIKELLILINKKLSNLENIKKISLQYKILEKLNKTEILNNEWIFKYTYNSISDIIDIFYNEYNTIKETKSNLFNLLTNYHKILDLTEIIDERYILCSLYIYLTLKDMKVYVSEQKILNLYDIHKISNKNSKKTLKTQIQIKFFIFFLFLRNESKLYEIYKEIKIDKKNIEEILTIEQSFCHQYMNLTVDIHKKLIKYNLYTATILNKSLKNILSYGPISLLNFIEMLVNEIDKFKDYFNEETIKIIEKNLDVIEMMDDKFLLQRYNKLLKN